MDRLENLHINSYEVPGLVPGLLGAILVLLGLLLAARAVARGALRPTGAPRLLAGGFPWRDAAVFAAMLFYPLVMVGHGLPFWLATGAFVAAFIFLFDRERQAALGRGTLGRAALALACGAGTSLLVSV